MLEKIPSEEELQQIMGKEKFKAWTEINSFIEKNYNVESMWDKGGKTGIYELKYVNVKHFFHRYGKQFFQCTVRSFFLRPVSSFFCSMVSRFFCLW